MVWFLDMDGAAWPATTGPIALEGDSIVIDGVSREVFRSGLSSITNNGVLFAGPKADVVFSAILELLAEGDGVVRCGVEDGVAFASIVGVPGGVRKRL